MRKIFLVISMVLLLVACTASAEEKQRDNSGKFKLQQGYYLYLDNVDSNGETATVQLIRPSGKIIAQQVVHEGDTLKLDDNGKLIVDGNIDAVFYGTNHQVVQIDNLNQYHKINGDVVFSDLKLTLIKPQAL